MANEIMVGNVLGFNYNPADRFYPVVLNNYPDGMPVIPFVDLDHAEYSLPVYPETMILRPQNLEQFVAGMFYCDAAAERGTPIRNLILPHVPGGRQDRINPAGDYLFTLKSVAKMINERKFDSVVVLDPHSTVTPALIDRCRIVNLADLLHNFWKGYGGVIAPDVGAAKRAFDVAQVLGLPFHQAEKHRDVATGKLSGFAAPTIKSGEHYLVVDDICDGGGTFLGLGEIIRAKGAYADLIVTHGIFSKGLDDLLKIYKKVITTDSTTFNHTGALTVPAIERLKTWTF
jgi:ribose-phosphate pyrophosphokinase